MPEAFEVFRFDLGPVDLLLAAGDFYAVASRAECVVRDNPGEGPPVLETKGRRHGLRRLEAVLAPLFGATVAPEPEAFAAFLARKDDGAYEAYVLERPFGMEAFPVRDFRLFPAGLRRHLGASGLVALRFAPGGRLQVLVAPAQLAAPVAPAAFAAPAGEGGGARGGQAG